MATFNVVITDAAHLAGITAARLAYNAALPEEPDGEGQIVQLKRGSIDTDAAYVQFVMAHAAESYANRYLEV